MRYACLALFGFLPSLGVSAPPQRCDDAPHSVTSPNTLSDRLDVPSKDPHATGTLPTRRQRIQSLKDRVNKLKLNLESLPPETPSESGASPLSEPQDVSHEPAPTDKSNQSHQSDPSASQQPVHSPVPVAPEPLPVSKLVQPPQLATPAETAPEPQPETAPEPEPELVLEPTAERTAPPPELPLPITKLPANVTPIPLPETLNAGSGREDTTLALPSELLDHAIDRQRMGNSLYAIGAYELALKNYEMMLREPLDSLDAQWVQFQVANCQRHLGQFAEAQKSYRRVTGETSEEWIGQTSRWWLKELDDREQLQRRVAELDQIIKTLSAEVNRDK